MNQMDECIFEKVKGPAWDAIRPMMLEMCNGLLSVSPDSYAKLTTIYAKFTLDSSPSSPVYAVMWLKSSKQITVGFALPPDIVNRSLKDAPKGMTYRGLTRYLSLGIDDKIPVNFVEWARDAFSNVKGGVNE
ncbi:hypothetical protein [Gimesia sp.]|uniref:hypothetical protein n=1 Tax=Gimesia sp. TaxID=2024833 RepID=UPI0032EEA43A